MRVHGFVAAGALALAGLGWCAFLLWRDPRSRSFAYGIGVGATAALLIVAAMYFVELP